MDSPLVETSSIFDLWRLHPRGDYLIARGGSLIPPPRHVNLTLTNKCNLRCEICGSQKTLDKSKTPRSHMDIEIFRQIAETTFPFLTEVELNSLGDPLFYPDIEEVLDTIIAHKCAYRIQHNGTLLTDNIIERLTRSAGMVSLSIDAVGPLFDQVRRNGIWEKASPGLSKLAASRDPKRVIIWIYPTVTQRTIGNLLDIVVWAHENNMDCVAFHDYDPIENSFEAVPDKAEKERQFEKISNFLVKQNSRLRVLDDSRTIYMGIGALQREMPSAQKARYGVYGFNFPVEDGPSGSRQKELCPVPWQSFGIDIEGQINMCCRSQLFPFGSATSVESFADVWLGRNLTKLRQSLTRGSEEALPLLPCGPCVHKFAPKAAKKKRSISYKNNVSIDQNGFVEEGSKLVLTFLRRENPLCPGYQASLPLGFDPEAYELMENGIPLGPLSSHSDTITEGKGRYCFKGNTLYFSSSDNSDPLRNNRHYELRRKIEHLGTFTHNVDDIRHDEGRRYFTLIPSYWADSKVEILENGEVLAASEVDDIDLIANQAGAKRLLSGTTLYFSLTDASDPRRNGRNYIIRRMAPEE
ncbi:MAG: radical SAM/SPASM domain-containing protein [Bdellovibrionales bacterium]